MATKTRRLEVYCKTTTRASSETTGIISSRYSKETKAIGMGPDTNASKVQIRILRQTEIEPKLETLTFTSVVEAFWTTHRDCCTALETSEQAQTLTKLL